MQEHLRGKQYTGWTRIRAKFKELEAKYKRSAPGRYSAPDDYSRRPAERERELRDYDGGYSRGGDQGGGDRRQDRYSERDRYDSRGGYGRDRGSDRYSERDRYGDRGGRDRYGDRRGDGSRGYVDRSVRSLHVLHHLAVVSDVACTDSGYTNCTQMSSSASMVSRRYVC